MFSASKSGQYQGYQISRSVRLRSSASAFFSRTLTTPTNNKIWTWSGWVKRGSLGTINTLFTAYDGVSVWQGQLYFTSSDTLQLQYGGSVANAITSTAVFRDPSAWYHVVVNVNATTTTSNIWVNNQLVANSTSIPTNVASNINGAYAHRIGSHYSGANYSDCYLTEINFIDGQALTPSSFGAYNAYGVWSPMKYNGTYGNNGFYLNFSDPSAATAAAIGKDYSGNGNNWTPNNISVTAGATYDSMLDVPTPWPDGGNGRGNYAVLNPLNTTGGAISAGNLNYVNTSATTYFSVAATMALKGKIYWEVTVPDSTTPLPGIVGNGILPATGGADANTLGGIANGYGLRYTKTEFRNNNTTIASGLTSYSDGAVLAFAYDSDTGKLWYAVNNTWQASGDPAAGTNPIATTSTTIDFFPAISALDSGSANFNFGQRPFAYTPPSGFRALNTQNLPTPTIAKGNQYFDATLYTGNSSTQSIVNSGAMQPDFVWIKDRTTAYQHCLFDAVRGVQIRLESNTTAAEQNNAASLTAFNSNGFSLGNNVVWNGTGDSYVAWQWKAGGTPAVTNTAGSITSTVSAGATQGFSVVTYTGTGANATVGHGLNITPAFIIIKSRSAVTEWGVFFGDATRYLLLSTTGAAVTSSTFWNNTNPTGSTFALGSASTVNFSATTYVAYVFSTVAGFSRFGSYTGNGSTDGPFVFTGFRPRYVLVKRTDGADSWQVWDTARDTYNVTSANLYPNLSNAEVTDSTQGIDIVANGFKLRTSNVRLNASGGTYIFAAFAENPTKYALAR